jgi:hypothetical protein
MWGVTHQPCNCAFGWRVLQRKQENVGLLSLTEECIVALRSVGLVSCFLTVAVLPDLS